MIGSGEHHDLRAGTPEAEKPAMSTTKPPADAESNPHVKAAFDDIRAARKSDLINNLWQ